MDGWLRQSVLYLVVGSLIKCPDTLQQESECFQESWQLLTLSPSCFARCMVPPVIYPVRFSSPHFLFFSLCGMLYLISLVNVAYLQLDIEIRRVKATPRGS
jgi:hypothetical protein